jgi:hypothetical protein
MRALSVLLLLFALVDAKVTNPALIRLKDGTVYRLKDPPHLTGGRYVFTTTDGRLLSLSEKEVAEVLLLSPNPPPRTVANPQDSRALGAIASQQRKSKGHYTSVAPAPTPRPTNSPAP